MTASILPGLYRVYQATVQEFRRSEREAQDPAVTRYLQESISDVLREIKRREGYACHPAERVAAIAAMQRRGTWLAVCQTAREVKQ